jgi:hypothetical protein
VCLGKCVWKQQVSKVFGKECVYVWESVFGNNRFRKCSEKSVFTFGEKCVWKQECLGRVCLEKSRADGN